MSAVEISKRDTIVIEQEIDLDVLGVRDWIELREIVPRPVRSRSQWLEILDAHSVFLTLGGLHASEIDIGPNERPMLAVSGDFLADEFARRLASGDEPDVITFTVRLRQGVGAARDTPPDVLTFEVYPFRAAEPPEVDFRPFAVDVNIDVSADDIDIGSLHLKWKRDVRYSVSPLHAAITLAFAPLGFPLSAKLPRQRTDATVSVQTRHEPVLSGATIVVDLQDLQPGDEDFELEVILSASLANVLARIDESGSTARDRRQLDLLCTPQVLVRQGVRSASFSLPPRTIALYADMRERFLVRIGKATADLARATVPMIGSTVVGIRGAQSPRPICDPPILDLTITAAPRTTGALLACEVEFFADSDPAPIESRTLRKPMSDGARTSTATIRIDISTIKDIESYLPDDVAGRSKLRVQLRFLLTLSTGEERRYAGEFFIEFLRRRAVRPICIDIGTSATAVWVAELAKRGTATSYEALPLGEWLEEIDKLHSESSRIAQVRKSVLIPSHIGLAGFEGLRARYNPASLGDLRLALDDRDHTLARLQFLDRTYDISVPFPNSNALPGAATRVFKYLKAALTAGRDEIPLKSSIYRRNRRLDKLIRTQKLEVTRLLEDYIDELVKLYVFRHVATNLDGDADEIDDAVRPPQFVITHPCGVGNELRRAYQDAFTKVVGRFASDGDDLVEPLLFPESFAAGRYALQRLAGERRAPTHPAVVAALDIGAGTFDVSIFAHNGRNRTSAMPLADFGVPLGGNQLDRAIYEQVDSILRKVAADRRFTELFRLNTADRSRYEATLERGVLVAKVELSRRLLADSTLNYSWRDEPFRLPLFEPDPDPDLSSLVTPVEPGRLRGRTLPFSIDGEDVVLAVQPDSERGDVVTLDIPRALLDGRSPNLANIVEGLGKLLPDIAVESARKLAKSDPVYADRDICVIVTGRTALWPPLFSAIRRAIELHSGAVLLNQMPFDPESMKKAVVLGGALGQSDPELVSRTRARSNPLAIVRFGSRVVEGPASSNTIPVVEDIVYVTDYAEEHTPVPDRVVKTPVPDFGPEFQLVRAIPGLANKYRRDRLNALLPRAPTFDFDDQARFQPRDFGPSVAPGHGRCEVSANADGVMMVTITFDGSGTAQSVQVAGDEMVRR